MSGRRAPSWVARLRKAWAALRGTDTPAPLPTWQADDVKGLAQARLGNRDARLLLLFCEGGRPTVPGEELTRKFGCGEPFDLARDLPLVARFCGTRLPSPIVRSGGTAEQPTYALAWSREQARLFIDTLELRQQGAAGTTAQGVGRPAAAQSPAPTRSSA